LSLKLKYSGQLNRKEESTKVKGKQRLRTTDKRLIRISLPNVKLKVLQNVYEMMCESIILPVGEIRGVKGGREITDDILGRFCKRIISSPRNTAEWELRRERRRDKGL
jgi:hypothetical protein